MLEPTEALESTENALRLVVRQLLGDTWQSKVTGPRLEQFKVRMAEEAKRRDGVATSTDLLAFTDFTDLTGIVLKEWESFKPVFDDQSRLKTYFGLFEDVRNAIAHSRPITEFEQELLSGASKQLRNQVALYRVTRNASTQYYPLIESTRDMFGTDGTTRQGYDASLLPRLEVGTAIEFVCRATDSQRRPIVWRLGRGNIAMSRSFSVDQVLAAEVTGGEVSLRYVVTEDDIGECLQIAVFMASAGRYHRYPDYTNQYDDSRYFYYIVNPPLD